MKHISVVALCGVLPLVSACDMLHMGQPPAPPATASLTRSLEMVDSAGIHYGHVEIDPVGGNSKVFDADGKLLGRIVSPQMAAMQQAAVMQQATIMPTAAPAPLLNPAP